MNQPRSTNPALRGGGGQTPQQAAAPPQQQPQQGAYPPQGYPQEQPPPQQPPPQQPPGGGGAGLVGPDGQPVQQQYLPLRLNPHGIEIPTPSMNPHELAPMLGGSVPMWTVLTWVELAHAFNGRDAYVAYLERRVEDLERNAGVDPVSFETFAAEATEQMEQGQGHGQTQGQGQGGQ